MLRPIEYLFRRLRLVEALGHDFVRNTDHLAKQRFLSNEFDVVVDVDQMRNAVEQAREIGNASRRFELRCADKLFLDGDQVDRLRFLDKVDHPPVNDAMRIQVEVFGLQILQNPIVIFVVDEYGAENGLLGVDVMRERSFERLRRHKNFGTQF